MLDKFESVQFAPQVTVPTLLLAAENDEIIPGAGHNTISESSRYLELLARAL